MTTEAVLPDKTGNDIEEQVLLKQDPMHGVKNPIKMCSVLICSLPNCNKAFHPDIHNQEFCCAEHQTEFWRLARRLGRVVMDEIQKEREGGGAHGNP